MKTTPVNQAILTNQLSYGATDDRDVLSIIRSVREGIKFTSFSKMVAESPFTLNEWSGFLHLSERTMQRYKKVKGTFDALHSEKIIEIALLFQKGIEVFGTKEKFYTWLDADNIILGGVKPKSLLDNTFGINLLKDELIRIEYGVLA